MKRHIRGHLILNGVNIKIVSLKTLFMEIWVISAPFHLNKPGFAWMPSDSNGM